ncbi:MAG: YjbF family lipoprotein [Rhizomicrobium sp.]|jgi:predicted small secreted protein
MMRHAGIIAGVVALATTLTACGAVEGDSDILRLGDVLLQQYGFSGGGDSISREKAASVPYASMGARLGSGAEALLVLATSSGDNLNWQAGTHVAISTRDGRIIRTAGLEHNLDGFQGPIADSPSMPPEHGGPYHFLYDMVDMGKYGVFVRCTRHDVGEEQVEIIGVAHDTRHIVENCKAKQLDWRFSNDFWQDAATGFVWKSVQNFRPDMDALTLETLRPAS